MTAVLERSRDEKHPAVLWAWRLLRLDFTGIAFAALFFCLSLTPSLLPRDWLFAGLIGGINAAIGYGIGVFVVKMVGRFVLAGHMDTLLLDSSSPAFVGGVFPLCNDSLSVTLRC